MQTIILAEGLSQGLVDLAAPALNGTAAIPINGTPLECSRIPSAAHALTLADAYAAACPVPFSDLGERLGSIGLQEMVERWKLTTPPALEIPAEATEWDASILSPENSRMEAIGQGSLTASPLQMALVAATLANGGEMPAPRLTLRIQEAEGSWREHPAAGERQPILRPEVAKTLLDIWPVYGIDVKGHGGIAIAGQGQQPHRWFLGIAPADTPRYAVAVLIERTTVPQQAIEVGTTLLQAVSR